LRRWRWVVALAAGGVILSIAFLFTTRAFRLQGLRSDLDRLHANQVAALAVQDALRDELSRVDDPEAIEERARASLGLVMPGEEKVLFIKGE